ncbi:autoinducer binding domain-containing protein [Thioclava sp. 15-R06ZXC-3]|uniref:Autoinducer binding domain-containing protein n=1 Tax=Thioclava arctica TaxID=3238301 RepID=A0ABV3TKP6_9RHOB
MINAITIRELLQRLRDVSDWTFAVGLHIRFANPTLLYQTYPQSWIDYYNDNGLVFVDPTVQWAVLNAGVCDWSDLVDQDTNNVLGQAADFGLRHGKVVAIGKDSRTFGFFAHSSRLITCAEIEAAKMILEELHEKTQGVTQLSENELVPLRDLSGS